MKSKFKIPFALFLLLVFSILLPTPIHAVCPICTVAVGAGLGISKALGIDDSITSVWIGGLILSTSFWAYDLICTRRPKLSTFSTLLIITIATYAAVIVPLWRSRLIGRFANSLFGIDKILFGIIIGSTSFLLARWVDKKVRQLKGKQLFAYQKVVFPIFALLSASLALYFVTK